MKKRVPFTLLFLGLFVSMSLHAQRGVRIGYIDMEYILSEMSSYHKAINQLEEKSKKWKNEITLEKEKIQKIETEFEAEKPLLTPSLIEEKLEEIAYEKTKLFNYQQKRFGPKGDWVTQQENLIQPIQDQVLTIVQQIAAKKKFDFVFDRTSDVFMLYSEKKYDISELVLKNIKKAEKLQNAEGSDLDDTSLILEDDNKVDPEQDGKLKRLDEKKVERTRILEEKKAKRARLIEEKRKAYEAKKLQKEKEKEEKRKAYEAKKKAERESLENNQETEEK